MGLYNKTALLISLVVVMLISGSVQAEVTIPFQFHKNLLCKIEGSNGGIVVNSNGKRKSTKNLRRRSLKRIRTLSKKIRRLSSRLDQSRAVPQSIFGLLGRSEKLQKLVNKQHSIQSLLEELSSCRRGTLEPEPEPSPNPTPSLVPTQSPTPTPGPTPTPPQQQSHVVFNFDDSVLHDTNWLLSQPAGTAAMVVQPKSDSGADQLSLAIGQGRNGSNALLVESTQASMGLPGFWGIKYQNKGGWLDIMRDSNGYILPNGKRANRLEFWVRFEDGFRSASAAAQPPSYPNHQNLHFGTYHFDPAKIGTLNGVVESDNWHFYHQVFLRHDKAKSDWIHVVLNELPQHQRGLSSAPPLNPTRPAGNYWELLTRFYVDPVSYFANPEKPYPLKMWVDDVRLSYVPDDQSITIQIENYSSGSIVPVQRNTIRDLTVQIHNNTANSLSGELYSTSPYWMSPAVLDPQTFTSVAGAMTLAPGENRTVLLRVQPFNSLSIGRLNDVGLTFVPADQFQSDASSQNQSFSDSNVEKRWYPETGPHDGKISGSFVRAEIAS